MSVNFPGVATTPCHRRKAILQKRKQKKAVKVLPSCEALPHFTYRIIKGVISFWTLLSAL